VYITQHVADDQLLHTHTYLDKQEPTEIEISQQAYIKVFKL